MRFDQQTSMRVRKVIVLFFVFALTGSLQAQEYNQTWYWKRKTPNSRRVNRYACPVLESVKSPHAIGVRIGEPIGITYKAYFLKRFGFEVIAGTSIGGVYVNFIRDQFDQNPAYDSLNYVGHVVNYTVTGQARLVMHNPLPEAITGTRGVDWYIGVGGMYRLLNVRYTYERGSTPTDFEIGSITESFNVAGPEAFIGFEYLLPGTQVAAFAEGGVFFDLLNSSQDPRFQGGIGLRYNL